MNTAVAGTTSNGTNAQNIGFAIPSSRVLSLIPSLIKGGAEHARKGGYLGVYIETNSRSLAAQYNLSITTGAVVVEIQQGLPAANAGIQQADVIVSIGSTTIRNAAQVSTVMANSSPGEVVQVGIVRGTQHLTIPVTLGTPPAV
jgi:S1-C subfamily serine protease